MITISVSRPKRGIEAPREILSHFIEHLGLCIENGIWMYDDTGAQLLEEPPLERVRVDLLNAIQDLAPPIIRYPGGCFSDTYHWQDGIGARENRPTRKNKAWGGIINLLGKFGPKERNHFGTDEFLGLCEKVGAEPYLNVNYGTGTPEEAANWVEYTNGDSEKTKYGKLRASNGHPEPYDVKYWGIANEIYGFWEKGYERKPEVYGKKYIEFALEMRKVDPTIKLIAVGWDASSAWNRKLLGIIKDHVDYLSIHRYFGNIHPLRFILKKNPYPMTRKAYYIQLNSASTMDSLVKATEDDILGVMGADGLRTCKIAFDEWNVWKRFNQACRPDNPHYRLVDGLWTALTINAFIRNSHSIGMANFAQLVNCLGMILTYDDEIVFTPQYHVFKMYSDAWHPVPFPVTIDGENITTKKYCKGFPAVTTPIVDATVLASNDSTKMSIFLVNKHFDEMKEVKIVFDAAETPSINGTVESTFLTHDDPFAFNSLEKPDEIEPFAVDNTEFDWSIQVPPHSFAVIKLKLKA